MPTANLALTPLVGAQSQKHITVNEALARLDAAAELAVLDRDLTDPPASPLDGERYLVASPATGAWLMQEGRVAAWDEAAQGWLFLTPKDGWRIWVADEKILLLRDGAQWISMGGDQLGVNTSADDTNRLAVASQAALFTHDGDDVQVKLNKAAVSDAAAMLFQTNYAGRAEIGLTGDDDLHIRTSADGSAFTDALVADRASGHVCVPVGATVGETAPAVNDSRLSVFGETPAVSGTTFVGPSTIRANTPYPGASGPGPVVSGGYAGTYDFNAWSITASYSGSWASKVSFNIRLPIAGEDLGDAFRNMSTFLEVDGRYSRSWVLPDYADGGSSPVATISDITHVLGVTASGELRKVPVTAFSTI